VVYKDDRWTGAQYHVTAYFVVFYVRMIQLLRIGLADIGCIAETNSVHTVIPRGYIADGSVTSDVSRDIFPTSVVLKWGGLFEAVCFDQEKFLCIHTKDLHTVLIPEPGATFISVQVCTVAVVFAFDLTFKPTAWW
jgi:hypothetical protein